MTEAPRVSSTTALTALAQEALLLVVLVSLPVLTVAALAGLVVAVLQATTRVEDATLAHLPRLLVVGVALALVGPWMGSQISEFAWRVFQGG